ncbi:hypothetical protein [Luteibacter sp.]|uniref:hypothetical protein n=1 Tax=Luteibacter sp. TaxID=1886636 RepID=UPI003F7CF1B8
MATIAHRATFSSHDGEPGVSMTGMTEFRLTYDGPALIAHEMHRRDLAPALIAMSDLLEASAHALYGDAVKIDVHIKGPFKSGSFNIDFVAGVQWLQSVRDFLTGQSSAAFANATAILTAVGIVGKGLFSLLKWLRGRTVSHVEPITPDAQGFARVRVHAGEDMYEVRRHALDLLNNLAVRDALERVIKPLGEHGVEIFALGSEGVLNVIVGGDERIYFAVPSDEEVLHIDDVRDMLFSMAACPGTDTRAWRLSDGEAAVTARISDEPFLAAVEDGRITLLKGDLLACRTRVRQWRGRRGIRTEYELVQISRHIRADRHLPLPLDVFPAMEMVT